MRLVKVDEDGRWWVLQFQKMLANNGKVCIDKYVIEVGVSDEDDRIALHLSGALGELIYVFKKSNITDELLCVWVAVMFSRGNMYKLPKE